MSEDVQPLNDLGLLSLANDYISAQSRESNLWTAMDQAKKVWEEARDSTESIRKKMGQHTKSRGQSILVQIDDASALMIPMPRDGYSDTAVYPELHTLRGLAKLKS